MAKSLQPPADTGLEEAALLLGAVMLHANEGSFFEIRVIYVPGKLVNVVVG